MFRLSVPLLFVVIILGMPVRREVVIEYIKTPWQGDPRVNIQNNKGKAKAYQVKQVLMAIERLEVNYGTEK